jgi:hypothetical protein
MSFFKNIFRKRKKHSVKENSVFEPIFSFKKDLVEWKCEKCSFENKIENIENKDKFSLLCKNCGKKHKISGSSIRTRKFLFLSSKKNLIYVTNATARELKAKIENNTSIKVREKLIYHNKYECELAHKNYECKGTIIAFNSGVIEFFHHDLLNQCRGCRGDEYILCTRCKGTGYLPHFRHVSDGICFKCNGMGIEGI